VRTDDIEAVAERLGIEIADGARGALRWRLAGVAEAAAEPCLPFFIQWAPGSAHPSGGPRRLEQLDLTGDPARVAAWLGPHSLPIVVERGSPAVAGITLSAA
jgi:Glyoxalase-like domain